MVRIGALRDLYRTLNSIVVALPFDPLKKLLGPIVGPYALRAPELLLRLPFDTKVDIWALGCTVRPFYLILMGLLTHASNQTYELLTGTWLFDPHGSEPEVSDESDDDDKAVGGEEDTDGGDESGRWSRMDDHLAEMLDVTGEMFSKEMLDASPLLP
jgi:serine/threonine protein kinase